MSYTKKNCHNCTHLRWINGDSESGFICEGRDYLNNPQEEKRHLKKLEDDKYRHRGKVCFEKSVMTAFLSEAEVSDWLKEE